jgi:hypothetical protein
MIDYSSYEMSGDGNCSSQKLDVPRQEVDQWRCGSTCLVPEFQILALLYTTLKLRCVLKAGNGYAVVKYD